MTAAASTYRYLLRRLVHNRGISRPKLSRASGTTVSFIENARRNGSMSSRQIITVGVGAATVLGTALFFATTTHHRSLANNDESIIRDGRTSKLRKGATGAATTDQEFDDDSGYMEAERFDQCLDYHRSLLKDYNRRWGPKQQQQSTGSSNDHHVESNSTAVQWPRNTPLLHDLSALECDFRYCERGTQRLCQDAKFRIASFYVSQTANERLRYLGFYMLKDLAEENHADGMCYYGILLNRGLECANVGASPQEAVAWWLKCTDDHRHIQATYELATAYYLGEGAPENSERAVHLYSRAANLGHAGAAYILGECLLYGAGVERDRANALEWLVTAAELGHRGARDRVLMVLTDEATTTLRNDTGNNSTGCTNLTNEQASAAQRKQEEDWKWQSLPDNNEVKLKAVNIERRYTIGDAPRNNTSLEVRRQTIVSASRGKD